MPELGINIDHFATLRQARMGIEPDPIHAAFIAEQNGADQITIHLREDRRHIQLRDLNLLRQTVQTRLNLEMAATDEMIVIAKNVKPDTVTLVPERREELTTEGGLNLEPDSLRGKIRELKEAGIEVSVFIEPDTDMIKLADRYGADAVEMHTGRYANLTDREDIRKEIQRIEKGAKLIRTAGMRIVGGHGLNYHNVQALVDLGIIQEYNIGHSIVARALFTGFAEAVREMKRLVMRKPG